MAAQIESTIKAELLVNDDQVRRDLEKILEDFLHGLSKGGKKAAKAARKARRRFHKVVRHAADDAQEAELREEWG